VTKFSNSGGSPAADCESLDDAAERSGENPGVFALDFDAPLVDAVQLSQEIARAFGLGFGELLDDAAQIADEFPGAGFASSDWMAVGY